MPDAPGAGPVTGPAGAVATPSSATPARGAALPRGEETVRGIALIAGAYLVISGTDAAVKWALPEVGTAVAMIWRGVIGAACVALLARGRGLFPRNRRLLAVRSLLHTGVSATWYWAWARGMPLADSYAVAAAAPLLMTVLAIPMLGESVGWRRWTATLVGFGGVLVMLQPSGDLWRIETPALLLAVTAMAVTRIWTRVLARSDTPSAIAFWLMVAHVPMGLALLPAFPPPSGSFVPSLGAAVALIGFGAANAVAHILFGRAFALAPVAVLAPFEYSALIWGGLLGFLIWGEVPAWTTLGGAAIIVGAGLYTLRRERVRRAAERREAAAPRPVRRRAPDPARHARRDPTTASFGHASPQSGHRRSAYTRRTSGAQYGWGHRLQRGIRLSRHSRRLPPVHDGDSPPPGLLRRRRRRTRRHRDGRRRSRDAAVHGGRRHLRAWWRTGGDGHAKVFVAVDDSFAVFGIAAFGTSGWLRRVPINGGSMVYDNTDSDAQAEFSILISGATSPIAAHYVL